jgi:hypothetical protein
VVPSPNTDSIDKTRKHWHSKEESFVYGRHALIDPKSRSQARGLLKGAFVEVWVGLLDA